jgi:hypothetical protein
LNEVLSFSVLDALLNELFKLVACGFQVLFIIDDSRYDGLALEYAFSLFIEGRREPFLFGNFQLFLEIEHVAHVRLLSLLVSLKLFIEAINLLFFVGAGKLRRWHEVFDGGADCAERLGVLVDESAALDEKVLFFGVGDGALFEEEDFFIELVMGLFGLFELCRKLGDLDFVGVELTLKVLLPFFASIDSLLQLRTLNILFLNLINPQHFFILRQIQLFL